MWLLRYKSWHAMFLQILTILLQTNIRIDPLMDWKCFRLFGFANHLHRTKVCHKNSILHLFTILVISIYIHTHLHNKTPAVSALCTTYVIKNVVPNEMNATKQLFALSHSIISLQMFLHFWSNSWKFNKEIEFKKKSSFQQVH